MSQFRLDRVSGLESPGLSIIPPVSRGATLASQLSEALQAVGNAGTFAARTIAARRAEEKRLARDHEEQVRGQATLDYRSNWPELQKQIRERKIMVPEGMDLGEFSDELIGLYTEGNDPIYQDQFRKGLKPLLVGEFAEQQGVIQQQAIDAGTERLIASASEQTTAAGISKVIDEMMRLDPLLTREQAIGKIAIPAGRAAAANGDSDRLKAAKAALGNLFPTERASMDASFESAKLGLRELARRDFDDAISGMYVDGRPYNEIRKTAREWRGKVDDAAVDRAIQEADSRELQDQSRSKIDIHNALVAGERQRIDSIVDAHLADATRTGGAATLNGGNDVVLEIEGRKHTFTNKELVEAATDRAMARIATEHPDNDQASLAAQVDFLSDNGITYKPWERVMNAGSMVTSLDLAAVEEGTAAIPANAANGYELYKRLGTMNPRLRDAHITSGTARDFYDLANRAEQFVTPGEPQKAMVIAAKAMTQRDSFANQQSKAQIRNKVAELTKPGSGFWRTLIAITPGVENSTAKNSGEIAAKLDQIADVYIALGLGPEDAVAAAADRLKQSHKVINGWAVDVGNKAVPADIEAIGGALIKEYVKRNKEEGASAGDLTLIPGETDATWIMYNRTTHSFVDKWATEGLFTNAELGRFWEGRGKKERQAAESRIRENQTMNNAGRNTQMILGAMRATQFHTQTYREFLTSELPKAPPGYFDKKK